MLRRPAAQALAFVRGLPLPKLRRLTGNHPQVRVAGYRGNRVSGASRAIQTAPEWSDDVGLIMQWCEQHHDQLSPFISWARGPSKQLAEKVVVLAEHMASMRSNPLVQDSAITALTGPTWQRWQDELLLGFAKRIARAGSPSADLTLPQVASHCPGMSVAIRSLQSAWRVVTLETPRKPKGSDFPDALHAAYAPYVDVFRADGFMSPFIAEQVGRSRATVVPKLSGLIATIDAASK